ncbi:hypothetical protein BRC64_05430 [Halobacteriales archaeon QH_10_67_22]|nr:MAG: hypothetical protein BRC64_05430 [Halobacteriales archaeon QH_10_67_22]
MAGNPNEYIEIGSDGIRFVMEHQSITSNEKTMIPREEVPVDEMPINNIVINGVSNIESVDDDSGTLIRMKYEEVEYTTTENGESEDSMDFYEKLESETGIQFDDSSQEFIFSDSKSDKENFANFIRVLFEEGHMTKDDLPYQTKYARNAYLLNTEPVDQKGEEMERTGEPVEGVFVATHYAKDQKKKYMKQLVNDFVKGESINK